MPPGDRAVLFDVWYTLVYLRPREEIAYVASLERTASDLLQSWPAESGARPLPTGPELRRIFRREFDRAAALSRRGTSWPPERQIRAVAERLRRRYRPGEFLDRIEEVLSRLPIQVAEEAGSVLRKIRSDGYRLGVVSNTVGEPGRGMRKVLDRLGLAEPVEVWAWSDEHPWAKPAPELFRWCLKRLGVPPARAIHVGDSWSDIVGAKWAGLHASVQYLGHAQYSSAYRKGFAPPVPRWAPPTRVVRSLGVVPKLVPVLFESEGTASAR